MTAVADPALRDLIDQVAAREPGQQAGELPQCWLALTLLGLPLAGIDPATGGSGGSLGDLVTLTRQLGRHALSTPLIESASAWQALAAAGHSPAADELAIAVLVSPPQCTDGRLRARVPWGRHCGRLVLATAAGRCYTAPRAALTFGAQAVTIAGEPRDEVSVSAADLADAGGEEIAAMVRARLGLLRAAAILGAAEGAARMTRNYAGNRVQFGRPLDAIPAVRTALARMTVAVTHSDAAVDRAVAAAGGPAASSAAAELAAALARLVTAQGATEVARTAHQLHGAMGITAEYGLGRYTARLWSWRDAGTAQAELAAAVGRQVREGGEPALWDSVTAWPAPADPGTSPGSGDH